MTSPQVLNVDELDPSLIPTAEGYGSQGIDGELIHPAVTDTLAPSNHIESVLSELSAQGGRTLGNQATGKLLAATYSQLLSDNAQLKSDLENERERRIIAEQSLAVKHATSAAERPSKILGTLMTVLGPLILGISVTHDATDNLQIGYPLAALGALLLLAGLIIPAMIKQESTE